MELRGSKTEQYLWTAFAAESQARNRYIYFADAAREAGLHDIADVFYELAANEGEHARKEFEFLGGIGDVRSNIQEAAEGSIRNMKGSIRSAPRWHARRAFSKSPISLRE